MFLKLIQIMAPSTATYKGSWMCTMSSLLRGTEKRKWLEGPWVGTWLLVPFLPWNSPISEPVVRSHSNLQCLLRCRKSRVGAKPCLSSSPTCPTYMEILSPGFILRDWALPFQGTSNVLKQPSSNGCCLCPPPHEAAGDPTDISP